jgi:hypothetical protein
MPLVDTLTRTLQFPTINKNNMEDVLSYKAGTPLASLAGTQMICRRLKMRTF